MLLGAGISWLVTAAIIALIYSIGYQWQRLAEWLPKQNVITLWLLATLVLFLILGQGTGGDGIMDLTNRWNVQLLFGDSPYNLPGTAYPPLAMFVFAGLGLIGPSTAMLQWVFPIAMILTGFFVLMLLHRLKYSQSQQQLWIVSVLSVGAILFLWRYEILPAACSIIALMCLERKRPMLSYTALGVGIALKPYLLVLVPLWALWEMHQRTTFKQPLVYYVKILGCLAVPTIAAAALMTGLVGTDWWASYGFQATRSMTMESTASTIARMSILFGAELPTYFAPDCQCQSLSFTSDGLLKHAFTLGTIGGLFVLYGLYWRVRQHQDALAIAATAAITWLVLMYPVFSPQYVIWILPLAVVASGAQPKIGYAAVVAALAVNLSFPLFYGSLITYDIMGVIILWSRIIAMICIMFYAITSLWKFRKNLG